MVDAPDFEVVIRQAKRLSSSDQLRLAESLLAQVRQQMIQQPKRDLYGLWAGSGTAPSAGEIDEARNEIWRNFPREDI